MIDLHNIIPRIQVSNLQTCLKEYPVVILQGARQTGKSTLARIPSIGFDRTYITLDDFDVLDTAKRDPSALFIGHDRVTLDEVQRQPDILLAIKADVDRNRIPGRFLLTGSANLLLMKNVAENLAGRAVYFHLPPFTWSELEKSKFGGLLDTVLEKNTVEELVSYIDFKEMNPRRSLSEAIFAGGYPIPSLSDDVSYRARWFDGYIQTYLERDLRDLSATGNLIEFRRLMQICASRNGRLFNSASIASDSGISQATARRYLNILETSFQIVRIPAYAVNRGKRVIKAPKLYWSDTGLAAHMAGIFSEESLVGGREWGLWLENWIGIHLLVYASLKTPRVSVFHWRTSNGHEVDYVLEYGKKLVPIEVKTTSFPSGRDVKGLDMFLDIYSEASFGIVACQCDTIRALSSKILAVPISMLLLT